MLDYRLRIVKRSSLYVRFSGKRSPAVHRAALLGTSCQATLAAWLCTALVGSVLMPAAGCRAPSTTFEIVDYRRPGDARRYHETFDEAYYDVDDHGNLDLVLRRCTPAGGTSGHSVTQVIHMRTVWRSIPGTTVAHRSQINATVSYLIVSGSMGGSFEGAGSVFFDQRKGEDVITGSLDLAILRPKRRLLSGEDLFKRAELTGTFVARRDPRRVVRIINEMNRLFGPLPSQHAVGSEP